MIFILISNGDPSSMCSIFTLRYDIYRSTLLNLTLNFYMFYFLLEIIFSQIKF